MKKAMATSACSKKHSTLENTRLLLVGSVWLQVLFWNNYTPLIEISVKYIIYMKFEVLSALLKTIVSIKEWLAATTFVK